MTRDDEDKIKGELKKRITEQLLEGLDAKVNAAYERYSQAEQDRIADAISSVLKSGRGAKVKSGVAGGKNRPRIQQEHIDQVLAAIKKKPGQKTVEIKDALHGHLDEHYVKIALARLRSEKKVKTKGAKAAMSYFPKE